MMRLMAALRLLEMCPASSVTNNSNIFLLCVDMSVKSARTFDRWFNGPGLGARSESHKIPARVAGRELVNWI